MARSVDHGCVQHIERRKDVNVSLQARQVFFMMSERIKAMRIDARSQQPVVVFAMLLAMNLQAFAQPPAPQDDYGKLRGFEPALTVVPPNPPRPNAEMADFVESLRGNDATFDVLVGQGRILTLKQNIAVPDKPSPVIALGDPTVVSFEVIGPRQIRLTGQRVGVTDLSVITADNEPYTFEIRVILDLNMLHARLRGTFPDARLKVTQFQENLVIEGQARDTAQVARVVQMAEAFLTSAQATQARKIQSEDRQQPVEGAGRPRRSGPLPADGEQPEQQPAEVSSAGSAVNSTVTIPRGQVINLLRVPGSQQVMLKVQVAELNRTAFRQLGASFLFNDGRSRIGTNPTGVLAAAASGGAATLFPNTNSIFAGVVNNKFIYVIDALRRNDVLKILAEPTLMAYHGHQGSFLAGGEFPVPVVQAGGIGGVAIPTVQFKEFGVRLGFLPYIQDGDVIRLAVASEVSSIDRNLGTVIVPGGTPVPGLNTRKSQTTVELRDGQTLAISGLMQVTLDGSTRRIPGLGDLPMLGPFFSNNTGERIEKELVILVTPHLVEPMNADQVGPRPGDEINEPNDLEFYLLGRIESRVGRDFRSTTNWDDPLDLNRKMKLEQRYCEGETGFSQ